MGSNTGTEAGSAELRGSELTSSPNMRGSIGMLLCPGSGCCLFSLRNRGTGREMMTQGQHNALSLIQGKSLSHDIALTDR